MSIVVLKNAIVVTSSNVSEQVPADIEAVIQAILCRIHGREVRIRSIRPVEAPEAATGWTIQGRVKIHASHNLRTAS
jgi:hypothetical protein